MRRLLQPGMSALDIGAAHGAYTVAMARAVGPTGRVVTFEPNAAVAAYLRQTIEGNKFGHVAAANRARRKACRHECPRR